MFCLCLFVLFMLSFGLLKICGTLLTLQLGLLITMNVTIVLKNLSVSLDPRPWESCADSGQLSYEGIHRFRGVSHLLSNDHDLFLKEVHEFN